MFSKVLSRVFFVEQKKSERQTIIDKDFYSRVDVFFDKIRLVPSHLKEDTKFAYLMAALTRKET